MEDEAEIYDGIRAQFPLTFGKQSKSQTPLEAIHNSTRRSFREQSFSSRPTSGNATARDFPSLSSSSKSWLTSINEHKSAKIVKHVYLQHGGVEHDVVKVAKSSRFQNGVGSSAECSGPQLVSSSSDDDRPMAGPPPPPPADAGGVSIGSSRSSCLNSDDESGDVMIGPPCPPPGLYIQDDDEFAKDDVVIGPPRPPSNFSSIEDEVYDSSESEESPYKIPLSNEIVLKGHSKVVSALAVDYSGSRVLSGSYDYTIRMYDFQGMNSRLASFRQLEPFEGHQVRNISWSPSADRFLCVTGSAQAKIYDRDGLTLGEFIKGDMYIRDLKNTKGHICGLTSGHWHPKAKETILTSSEDGSLRIWDVNDFNSQKQVIKPKLARPGRIPVTTCAWDGDGKCIAGGIGDGAIQIWNIKPGWGSRPDIYIDKAHSDDITGLKFSSDKTILLSRSFDASLKVWDLRQTKGALKVFEELPNNYAQTNIAFSPDEQLFFTGTSIERDSTSGGLLYFYDREKLELVSRIGVSATSSVVQCLWHPKLNQIFATTGDKKEGGTHILYDPSISERGALVCVARAPRKMSVDDFDAKPVIHNPHALPLFRDQPSRKRQREKILKDPLKSHKPELPVTGPGFGGRVGTTKGSLLTQYLLKQGGLIKETWMEEDPREAILKYADVAAKDPKYIAPAYAETQPEPVFAETDSADDSEEVKT